MTEFRFHCPIDVRYADIDLQGHVNNVTYFTYFEHGRLNYLRQLGLWDEVQAGSLGILLAHAACTYRAPITLGQSVRVGVAATRLGRRSFELAYRLDSPDGSVLFAGGSTVQVMYDHRQQRTVPLPNSWRLGIGRFEDLDPG